MQQMLADNAAAAEAVIAGARGEQMAAAAALQAARQQLAENERDAVQILQDYTTKHRARLKENLRKEMAEEIAERLLEKGEPVHVVAALLELADWSLQSIAQCLGHRKVGSADAWLRYDESGRSGYVILHHGRVVHRFSYEFAGGSALAVIDVPTAGYWEANTGLPLEEREEILAFVGAQVVADRAPGYHYRIGEDTIVIY